MQEIMARATIKMDTVYNTGFIHIKDSLIEGVFTLDYVHIMLADNTMSLFLKEHHLDFLGHGLVRHRVVPTIFTTHYSHRFLYVPDTYPLCDASGHVLILSLDEVVHDRRLIESILRKIEIAKS